MAPVVWLLLLPFALGAPFGRHVREEDVSKPDKWHNRGRASTQEPIELIFAVKQTNLHILEEFVLASSDPDSKAYGNHLSLQSVNDLVAPTKTAIHSVRRYLAEHGVDLDSDCESTSNSDFIRCVLSVGTAEALLGAKYHYYHHKDLPDSVVMRTETYSLPVGVSEHIDFVSPTVRFPTVQKRLMRDFGKKNNSKPDYENTPASLRELYNVGDTEGTLGRQSCTAFLEQYYEAEDLNSFWSKYYPKAVGRSIKLIGPDMTTAGVEASLDIEYITTMGGGIDTEFWSFAGRAPDNPENEPFLKWMYTVANTSDADVPKVFSTSYGEAERTVSMDYMHRIQAEFQKAAARGISLLFASGDYGVTDQGTCHDGRFQGQWPAGSPWVTGVGGTMNVPETSWDGSSGGFSDRWTRPSYQKEAVDHYLKTLDPSLMPNKTRFNLTGAGFPDVAAQSTNFVVINDGITIPVAGTSAACPTFSGIVSLLNDLRLSQNKTTLGFLNPLFYKHPEAFNDIKLGSSQAGFDCGPIGFSASQGWDPVTGLGTPNYGKLANIVKSLN